MFLNTFVNDKKMIQYIYFEICIIQLGIKKKKIRVELIKMLANWIFFHG